MKKSFFFMDLLYLLGTGFFFFSCIATTLHVAKTLEPGQAEVSAGYMQARDYGDFSGTPVQLLGATGRAGVSNNFDLGVEYTQDVSKENEGAFSSIWADGKYQITNRNNEYKRLTFSSGLLKGYVYNKDIETHITSIPFYFSIPVTERFTPTFMYRYELLSENILPDNLGDPRNLLSLGLEYYLMKPDYSKWNTKFAISVGTIEGDAFLINLGFKFISPLNQP